MTIIFMLVSLIYGSILSSFYNLVSYRVPKKCSIVSPGSSCGSCGEDLKLLDLIPVFSCLLNKGRCRYCKEYYGIMHALMELYVGVMFALSSLLILHNNYVFVVLILVITFYNLNRVSKDIHGVMLKRTSIVIFTTINILLLLNFNIVLLIIINLLLIVLVLSVINKTKIFNSSIWYSDIHVLIIILISVFVL